MPCSGHLAVSTAGGYHGDWTAEVITVLKFAHHEPQEELIFYEVLQAPALPMPSAMVELGGFWSQPHTCFGFSMRIRQTGAPSSSSLT